MGYKRKEINSNSVYEDCTQRAYGDITRIQERYDVGRSTAMKLGKESGALIKLGKRSIYDLDIIDHYLESIRLKNASSDVSDVIAETKKARADYNQHRS